MKYLNVTLVKKIASCFAIALMGLRTAMGVPQSRLQPAKIFGGGKRQGGYAKYLCLLCLWIVELVYDIGTGREG